jgi:predicted transcriptional regulator
MSRTWRMSCHLRFINQPPVIKESILSVYLNHLTDPPDMQVYASSAQNDPIHQEEDTGETNYDENEQDDTTIEQDDPLRERILSIALELFKSNGEITIQDVVDASNIKESPIRHRLSQLVSLGKLSFARGTGRRPNYYYLPKEVTSENSDLDDLHELAKLVKQKEMNIHQQIVSLQQEREKVLADLSAIERTIEIKQEYGGTYD